ncbi:MAG: magnesium-translocating P-type ATPase [Caulobacteraceae bacterium]|nr:magnesium-translocating P-type ATPase [Caulobacteraceae bacterium]
MNAAPPVSPRPPAKSGPEADGGLIAIARVQPGEAIALLHSSTAGLSAEEAAARLKEHGPNHVAREGRLSVFAELRRCAWNPLNGLLLTLALASWGLGDARAAIVIAIMVVLSIGLGFIQEHRSNQAAARLYAMVRTMVSVKRPGAAKDGFVDEPMDDLVPGDIVRLAAGDMIPADVRLLTSKDLHVNQSALTGESNPSEKSAEPYVGPTCPPMDLPSLAFMGSNVVSGFAEAVVVRTGGRTDFGKLAQSLVGLAPPTSFDKGIEAFTRMMLGLILVMAPAVFLINGLTKGNWIEALFFAVAVAVGLTPEMLPMIVTVNLAQGAMAMSRKKVIVKRLNAIQNFGAMDIQGTDKTGTLTENHVALKLHLDVDGNESDFVLTYAYLNSRFETGIAGLLDAAILEHAEVEDHIRVADYRKLDEIPFDFQRRRLSVLLADKDDRRILICKGAVEEVFACCARYRLGDNEGPLDADHAAKAKALTDRLNAEGFRVVAVACREFPKDKSVYAVEDEADLTLVGYIGFLDPPKASAASALAALAASGIAVKVLTGDNAAVTGKICGDVGLGEGRIVLGSEIDALDDDALGRLAEEVHVFAKVSPAQKARVIQALQKRDHVVGFMGDGINDGPSLKMADVGVSVEDAVDIAKESADIILLEKSLAVLQEGVIEGRRVFGNITKYIKMGASSNFGNMFSVLGASIFLPFLPMAPIQVLTNNLLYDFSQTAIPTDRVDDEYLAAPRKWRIGNLLRFMVFIGPISSIFDYATFAVMIYVFHAWTNPSLFQTGWFVESLLTQTLIIHIIRTAKIPFIQSRASIALIATSLAICVVGISLPYTWVGRELGFQPLPGLYWPILAGFMLCYATLTHIVKSWFMRRWGY